MESGLGDSLRVLLGNKPVSREREGECVCLGEGSVGYFKEWSPVVVQSTGQAGRLETYGGVNIVFQV